MLAKARAKEALRHCTSTLKAGSSNEWCQGSVAVLHLGDVDKGFWGQEMLQHWPNACMCLDVEH